MHEIRRAILDVLKRRRAASLAELASELGRLPITVRAHVQVLARDGLIAGSDVRGKRGRPYRIYRLTPLAEEQYFPKHYDALALQLISSVAQVGGREALRVLVDQVADNLAEPQRARLAGKPFEERVAEVARIMAEHGGEAELEQTGDGYVVQEYNCPYLRVSRESVEVCEIDRQFVAKLVGAPVHLNSSRLRDGAPCCSFAIPDRRAAKVKDDLTASG